MNPILCLTHNGLEMTKKAVDSFLHQDIPVSIFVIDNGSTDGTLAWLDVLGILLDASDLNVGVSAGWNQGLKMLFEDCHAEHVLVCNNDVEIPRWFYRYLLNWHWSTDMYCLGCQENSIPAGSTKCCYCGDQNLRPAPVSPAPIFITGVSSSAGNIAEPKYGGYTLHPDFSAFLIRRAAWEAIGPFDEGMRFYAQDCDYHVRACHEGVPLLAANAPFYHERSSTLRLAAPEDAAKIGAQADADRAYFLKKWGFPIGSEEYARATSGEIR